MSARTPEQRAWLDRLRNAGWKGSAPRFESAIALRILGRRDLDPRDVVAWVHDTEELARLSAEANADALDAAGLSDTDLLVAFQQMLFNIFGPSGLDLLVDRRGDMNNTLEYTDVTMRTFTGGAVTEGGFKSAITAQRDFLSGLLGTTGSIAPVYCGSSSPPGMNSKPSSSSRSLST